MRMTKKFVALVLCVLMVAAVLPMGVFAADELQSNDFDIYLPFDDATEQVATYFNRRAEGSNLEYQGNTGQTSSGYFWSNYVTEENGNKYVQQPEISDKGYTIRNAAGYNNFDDPFRISLRFKVASISGTSTTALYDPVIRVTDSSNQPGGTQGGFANILVIANKANYPGEAPTTDGSKYRVGYLVPGTNNSTAYNHTGYAIYSDTWYDTTVVVDHATGNCWFSVTDGTNEYEMSYYNGTMKGFDLINTVLLFRESGSSKLSKCVDDIRVTNNFSGFVAPASMSDLSYAVKNNVEQKYASSAFAIPGFAVSGNNNANWELVTEKNGNKYLSHLNGEATRSPITIADSINLLDGGDFAFSFDYRWGEGVPSNGTGMLSLKIDQKGATNEFRIINLGQNGGMYFGPAVWKDLQIGTLTTPASEGGARWHNIKVVFRPYVVEDYIDMNYEFYIDGDLAAYTDIVHGVYNFYTKATGSWTALTDLQPAKYVAKSIKSGDANGNGVADEGEEIVYNYEWVGRNKDLDVNCTWGESKDNIGRTPVGLWDGYAQVELDGSEAMVHQDGEIATIASIYMFHWNSSAFDLDNLKVECLEEDTDAIENVKLVGYQPGKNGTSLRFIACVDSLDFGQVGMDVQVFAPESDMANGSTVGPLWATKVDNKMSNSVYVALTADDEQVGAMEEFGARYFIMLSVYDIDSSATIRIRPYTTKNSVRSYGEAVDYVINLKDGKVAVEKLEVHTPDYSDGLDASGAQNGYCYNVWSSYTWDLLTTGVKADIGWGGESAHREVRLQDDGSLKINTDLSFKSSYKIQADVPVLDEEGNPTYDEEGKPVTEKVDVKDNEGKQLYNNSSFSRRIKFANIIPTNLEDYKGYTFVLTAKVRATQVNIKTTKDVVVGEGEDAVTYSAVFDEEDPDGYGGIAFGFMTDYQTWMVSANSYAIKNDGEWVEVQAAVNVDDALLAHEYVAPKAADLAPVTDAEGVVHSAPLRPTINLNDNIEDGYARELYVKDITLTVIPTPGYVAAE